VKSTAINLKETFVKKWVLSAMLLACLPAAAGYYDAPYAQFHPGNRSAVRDVARATITRIDDIQVRPGRSDPVAPGVHRVEVSVPGPRGMSKPGHQVLVIDARPCTRYYIAAKRSSRTSHDWAAYIDEVETIGECAARFKAAG
jgi:hypothetical protein